MGCPLCGRSKAKRACPALGQQICAICCGTKRLVEINCPSDCVYLNSARTHPPAVVQRQREQDRTMLLPLLHGFSERQARVFLMLAAVISRYQSDALQKLADEDVAQAAESLASTLETADRGIVYEPQPASLPAARLMTEWKAVMAEIANPAGAGGISGLERDGALALRRIEVAAKASAEHQPGSTLFQELLARVLASPPAATPDAESSATAPASSLIIP